MPGAPAETAAVALLVASVAFAVIRPRGLTEAITAVPAAALLVALGVVPVSAAADTLRELGPTVAFLAAILVFGHLCAEAGVFTYLGALAARGSNGSPRRLLVLIVMLAAVVTATLTLDATVVLLTPVVLDTVHRLRLPAPPHLYACARLANSASLLLPVSNLTNLLAFGASGLSAGRFVALMALPWLLVCAGEWVVLRAWFRRDLRIDTTPDIDLPAAPRYAFGVLAATVALLVLTASVHIAPAWAAALGCAALLVPRLLARTVRPRALVADASPGFCLFVLALAIVVDGVTRHGLGELLHRLIPDGESLLALLAVVAISALLANLVNNLPATLALIPVAAGHPATMLAVLLGVNIGPNATFHGSLATLLWRRRLPEAEAPRTREFHALGLVSVPALLVGATCALWVGLQLSG